MNQFGDTGFDFEQAQAEAPNPKGGLQWFGEAIDKPGAVMRSLIQGDFESAAKHAVPFGDTLFGWDAPRHYWSDSLQKNSGWDDSFGTHAAGFALDVLTDPLFIFGAGAFGLGKSALTGTGRAAGLLKRGLPATSEEFVGQFARTAPKPTYAQAAAGSLDVGEPMRKMFGFNPVPYGDLFGVGKPIPFNLLPGEAGEKLAAKAADMVLYNQVAMKVRAAFSALPLIGRGPRTEFNVLAGKSIDEGGLGFSLKESQKLMGEVDLTTRGLTDDLATTRATVAGLEGIAKRTNAILVEGLDNGNVLDAARLEPIFRSLIETTAPRGSAVLNVQSLDPNAFKSVGDRLDLIKQLNPSLGDGASLGPRRAEALAEQQVAQGHVAAMMGEAGYTKDAIERMVGVIGDDESPQLWHDTVGALETLHRAQNSARDLMVPRLGNAAEAHFARQAGAMSERNRALIREGAANPYGIERKDYLSDLQVTVKDSSRQPLRVRTHTDAVETLMHDPVLTSQANFSDEVLDLAKKVGVLPKADAQALLVDPNKMVGRMIRLWDGRAAFVQQIDGAGGMIVKVAGEPIGTLIRAPGVLPSHAVTAPHVGAIFDPAHKAYDEMLDAARHEVHRTGPYDAEAATKRLSEHYELTYATTAREAAGITDPQQLEAFAAEMTANKTEGMRAFLAKQPRSAIKEGYFNRDVVNDTIDYIDHAANAIKAAEYNTSMTAHVLEPIVDGKTKPGYITLTDLIADLHGAEHVSEVVKAYAEKTRLLATGQTGVTQSGTSLVSTGKAPLAPNSKIAKMLEQAGAGAAGSSDMEWAARVQVPKGAKTISRMFLRMHIDPAAAAGEVTGMIQAASRAMKALTYGIFGPSQNRNFISGGVMSIMGGMFSKANIAEIARWTRGTRQEGVFLAKNAKLAAGVPAGLDVTKDLISRSALDRTAASALWGADTMAARTGELFGPRAEGSGLGQLLGQATMGVGWEPKDFVGTTAGDVLREFPRALGWDKLASEGRAGGSAWKIGNRAVQQESKLLKATASSQQHVEFIHRAAAYKTLLEKGWTQADAMRQVEAVHYNYEHVGNLDRELAAYVPFWNWIRKNLPAQIKNLMAAPGGTAGQAVRGADAVRRSAGTLPSGLDESTTFASESLGGGPGQKLAVNVRGVFPWEDLNLLGTSGAGMFGRAPAFNVRSVEKMAGMLSPPLLAGIQALTGKELFSGQDLRDRPDYGTNEPNLVMAANTMLSRPIGLIRSAVHAGETVAKQDSEGAKAAFTKLLSKLTVGGIRTRQYIESEEKIRREREIVEGYLQGQPGVGMLERPYIREPDTADPALVRANTYLQKLTQQHERMRAQRRALGLQ